MKADSTLAQDCYDHDPRSKGAITRTPTEFTESQNPLNSESVREAFPDDCFARIRAEIHQEYAEFHSKPWIVGYSGGKDSTLVAHLVIDHLISLPRSERKRPVHVIANDTLVESPLVMEHARIGLAEIEKAARAFDLPVIVATTAPQLDHTFWVNLIGRGYPLA